jgi:predicted transposase/invertase (TIGR01784 family)
MAKKILKPQLKAKGKRQPRKRRAVNVHDAFFKNTFSYPEVAREYIAHFMDAKLVKNIDLDSLVLDNTSFVTSDLTEYFSDLVWHARYKTTNIKISFLFEHKSYPVPYPHLQLLRYILEHLNAQIKAKERLTVVIPILIYHGEEKWKVRPFFDYFEGIDEDLKRYIPNFDYNLTVLSDYADEELINMGIGKLLNVFLAMSHIRNIDYIINNFETIFTYAEEDLKNNQYLDFFQSIFFYLFKNIEVTDEELAKAVLTINQPLKSFTMSAYDMLVAKGVSQGIIQGTEKGFEKGIVQGIEKGIVQGIEKGIVQGIEKGIVQGIEKGIVQGIEKGIDINARKVIANLIVQFPDFTDSQIAAIAEATVEMVQQVRKDIAKQN